MIIPDLLSRLNCKAWEKSAAAQFMSAAFIDLSPFTDVEKAIERSKDCLLYMISKITDDVPRKWGQSSSNMEPVNPLQLDGKLPMQCAYFDTGLLGQFMPSHPCNRTRIRNGKSFGGYNSRWFSKVKVEAVMVWPQCFVGDELNTWKYILGILEQFCQCRLAY